MDGLMQLTLPPILYVYMLYTEKKKKKLFGFFVSIILLYVSQPASQPCHVLSVIICLHIQDIVLDTTYYFVYGDFDLFSLMYRVCT